jgi:3-hydroxyacyl-CoA dehydrogenase
MMMNLNTDKHIACLGAGLIGTGWATSFLWKGLPVYLCDPNSQQLANGKKILEKNFDFLVKTGLISAADSDEALSNVIFTENMAEAVSDTEFIIEAGPENYQEKQDILGQVELFAPSDAIFASSTSGLLISVIAQNAQNPERCLGAHPFNPPYLIPLVEISKGEKTSDETVKKMFDFLSKLEKEPIVLKKEVVGLIANRLALALYREAVELVTRGVCTIEDVDKAVCYGPGLRYASMGPNLLYHLGGGPYGIKGILQHIGPSVERWWSDMANWTKWPPGWVDVAAKGIEEAMANRPPGQGQTTEELARFRDEILLGNLKMHKKL